MELSSIGKHIKEKRLAKSWKQEELAEKTNLSVVYIGMIERGEKIPRLETFVKIINALDASADEILEDVVNVGYQVRMSRYMEKLENLPKEERETVFQIVEVLINQKQ